MSCVGIVLTTVLAMEDCAKPGSTRGIGKRNLIPIEVGRLTEAHNQDPFAMLRHEALTVDDSRMKVVTQIFQSVLDDSERILPSCEIRLLTFLPRRRARGLFAAMISRHIEEQRPLGFAFEAVWASQRIFLGHAGDAERLTGEAGKQNVMVGNVGDINLRDIARKRVGVVWKVGLVGLPAVVIPFAREDTPASGCFEPKPHPSDTGEQVDERKH